MKLSALKFYLFIACMVVMSQSHADFYVSEQIPADDIIKKNLQSFTKNVIVSNAIQFSKKLYVPIDVIEIIGVRENSQVYYCYEFDRDKFISDGAQAEDIKDLKAFKKSPACDNDVKLIRLHNNKWVLEMEHVGWRVIEQ